MNFWVKRTTLFIFILLLFAIFPSRAERTRVIETTDIGGSDPDDQQSLVHMLTLLDRMELEGFIYQSAWVPVNKGNEVIVTNQILDAYGKVWDNLCVHSNDFPPSDELRKVVKHGQEEAAMAGVGDGKDSPGSEWIIEVVDRKDSRPVWIAAWSGMNTLAQALWKVQQTRTKEEVDKFVNKIRVYDILGQDDCGAWMVTQFPNLVYIRNKAVYGWPFSDEWTKEHVQAVGELGKVYPDRVWATEGDSPSFLYVVDNGLNVPEHPDWGGWGGRFDVDKKAGIRSMDWVPRSGLDETKYDPYLMLGASSEGVDAICKWQQDIHNDFEARLIWSVTSEYDAANHHPIPVIGRDKRTDVVFKSVKAGDTVKLDASRSIDPDKDNLSFQWIQYKEPSSYKGDLNIGEGTSRQMLHIPSDAKGKDIHLILRVTDDGVPALTSYRRIVIGVK